MHTPLSRRRFLQDSSALACVSSVLQLRSLHAKGAAATLDTACIFVNLGGGASHFETFDPKPHAPVEVRGEFKPIHTSVPGVHFCELMPRQAQLMKHLAVVRSVTHHEASHIAMHMIETGYFLRSITNARLGEMPSMGSIIARLRGKDGGLPAFVSIPKPQAYSSPLYLGGRYNFFPVDGDPNDPEFKLTNLTLNANLSLAQIENRQAMARTFDQTQRLVDDGGMLESLDAFQRQAVQLLTGEQARVAFDLAREPGAMRDRYGRSSVGQRLLLARRLVEAGVPFVTVRTFDWDDHEKLSEKMQGRSPSFDQGLAALISDLLERGLSRRVLVVAMGEFGRTPRINGMAGRDHWPGIMSVLFAGGNYRMGQVIGASDGQGARPQQRPYAPQQVLGMVYRHLGIDPGATFLDPTGRPRYILEEREPIVEL